jgi:fumarate hydratase class II
MMPLIAYDLLDAIDLLAKGTRNFTTRLVDGLEADRGRAEELAERSLAMATALAPEIGYDRAAALAKEALTSGRTIFDLAREKSGIPEDRLRSLLDPRTQTGA